jgi:hypothetical protein
MSFIHAGIQYSEALVKYRQLPKYFSSHNDVIGIVIVQQYQKPFVEIAP